MPAKNPKVLYEAGSWHAEQVEPGGSLLEASPQVRALRDLQMRLTGDLKLYKI